MAEEAVGSNKEPSKNELKKLAKNAEKAVKNQAFKVQGDTTDSAVSVDEIRQPPVSRGGREGKVPPPAIVDSKAKIAVPKCLPAPPVDFNDPSALKVLTLIFASAFEEVAPNAVIPVSIIKKCDTPKFGDFQCSAAMPAFASLKKSGKPIPSGIQSPPQLAKAVVDYLGKNHPVVQDLQLQGPGFITFMLTPTYLQSQVQAILDQKSLSKPKIEPMKCLVDFSSPNIASTFCYVIM
jgi:hypothetical protein